MSTEFMEDNKTKRSFTQHCPESWEMIEDTLKGLFSYMSASFRFPEKWTSNPAESRDLTDQMKCMKHFVTLL